MLFAFTGVCTQHDLQYPFLTVRENLELVARLRCVDTKSPASQVNELVAVEVNNALAELQLQGKADEQVLPCWVNWLPSLIDGVVMNVLTGHARRSILVAGKNAALQ